MSKRDDKILIAEMVAHAEQAHSYGAGLSFDDFRSRSMVKMAVLHCVQIIGEAATRLSPELQRRHPKVPWRQIIGTRNILVHQYFEIDDEAVWKILAEDLAPLIVALKAILDH